MIRAEPVISNISFINASMMEKVSFVNQKNIFTKQTWLGTDRGSPRSKGWSRMRLFGTSICKLVACGSSLWEMTVKAN